MKSPQPPLEQHFRINDLSNKWGISRRTAIRLVDQKMEKVPVIQGPRPRFGRIKRRYTTRLVPESIVQQIYKEMLGGPK
jgi:hypothetical protein